MLFVKTRLSLAKKNPMNVCIQVIQQSKTCKGFYFFEHESSLETEHLQQLELYYPRNMQIWRKSSSKFNLAKEVVPSLDG